MPSIYISTFFVALMLISNSSSAQTVLATETFGAGSAAGTSANGFAGDMGIWTVMNSGVNGASCNNWYVSGEECGNAAGACGSACPGGDNSLHISAVSGLCGVPDCGAAYDETGPANQTNQRAISPTIDCTNEFFIELNFNYIAAQGDDGFWVEYSTDNGATWNIFTGGNVAATQCCGCNNAFLCGCCLICCGGIVACSGLDQGLWTSVNLAFPPAADNNNQVKFAFHWSNNGNGVGTDPSVAIDDVTVTSAILLPVELSEILVEQADYGNTLYWTTMSEAELDHFDIEHSQDGVNFHSLDKIESQTSSTSTKTKYQYTHQSRSQENYYRLRMVDINGDYNYSESVYIKNELGQIFFRHELDIYTIFGLTELQGEVYVYDLSGNLVTPMKNFDFSTTEIQLDLRHLNAGMYIINVKTNSGNKRFKILK